MHESVYIILSLLKALIIVYIIISVFFAFNISSHCSFGDLAYTYNSLNHIDYKKAFKPENIVKFIGYGLSYAIFYIIASVKLRIALGKGYKEVIDTVYTIAKKAYEDGLTPEELEERLNAGNEEEKRAEN